MSDTVEVASSRPRFAFGKNWSAYVEGIGEAHIREAISSLRQMLGVETLQGLTFLDIGSGSGIFSLAARRLGASVTSFDYDPLSVDCARKLRARHFGDDTLWEITQGSVLDERFIGGLGKYDIVYSWGVLHHTGRMWRAIELAATRVASGGSFFISIYNDQGWKSRAWTRVKAAYNQGGTALRGSLLAAALVGIWGPISARDLAVGRPFHSWRNYKTQRGMNPWRDLVDWVGGFPFEVAKPDEILEFLRKQGFELIRMKTYGGKMGCNQFVFRNKD